MQISTNKFLQQISAEICLISAANFCCNKNFYVFRTNFCNKFLQKFVGLLQYKFLLQSNKFLHKISCCNPTSFCTKFLQYKLLQQYKFLLQSNKFLQYKFLQQILLQCNKFLEKKFLQQIFAITISVANFYCIFLQFHCIQSQFYYIFLLHTVTTHSTQHTVTTHKFLLHINSTNTYSKHSNNSQLSVANTYKFLLHTVTTHNFQLVPTKSQFVQTLTANIVKQIQTLTATLQNIRTQSVLQISALDHSHSYHFLQNKGQCSIINPITINTQNKQKNELVLSSLSWTMHR